jgi:hypothetical protein
MTAPARAIRLVLALALLPAATAAEVSDLSVYFADPATGDIGSAPEDDTCTYSTVFGQSMDAQAGCGIPIVVDGVLVNQSSPPIVTWIANGRNAIHIKTRTQEIAPPDDQLLYNITVGLQVSSYSDDRVRLCDQMTVLREGYKEGMTYVPITNLGDPTRVDSDATILARAAWRNVRPDIPCLGGGRWLPPLGKSGVSARAYTIASLPPSHSTPSIHPAPSSPQPHPHLVPARRATRATRSTRSRTRCGQFMGHRTPSSPSCSSPTSFGRRVPHRAAPPHRTAPHRTAPRRAAPHRAAPRRAAPHRAAPRRTAPHRLGAQNVHTNCSIDPASTTLVCNCDRYLDAGGEMTARPPPPPPPPAPPLRERDGTAVAMHRLSPGPAPRAPRTRNRRGAETFRTRRWSPSGSPCR